jgi:glycine C-acetyltransferase
MNAMKDRLLRALAEIEAAGLTKRERAIVSPQGALVTVAGRDGTVLNLCANNYLGLANDPRLVAAAHAALDRYGFGLASVRFICGTQDVHQDLERALSRFLGTEDTVLYGSCFDANGGLFETLLAAEDAVVSDELNHASIIDGIRLCKAQRYRYRHGDMADLRARLAEARAVGARFTLIATDGVFSMDGSSANLPAICDLADEFGALVMVDDSHGVGVVGPGGRGTPAQLGVTDRVDVVTGTFGKALGGASGGYASGRGEIVAMLRQRSRPYLFSNSVPPAVVGATIEALRLAAAGEDLRDALRRNTRIFRGAMQEAGFELLPGEHPIVPVIFGEAQRAVRMAEVLFGRGVYVTAFHYPVVPMNRARIRCQVSAAHTPEQMAFAVDAFRRAREETAA